MVTHNINIGDLVRFIDPATGTAGFVIGVITDQQPAHAGPEANCAQDRITVLWPISGYVTEEEAICLEVIGS
jgi:hypothetical protein